TNGNAFRVSDGPKKAAAAVQAASSRPRPPTSQRKTPDSSTRTKPAGSGRPATPPFTRGVGQSSPSARNDTSRASAAPTTAYENGSGRSERPPMPCARTEPPTSADRYLQQQQIRVVQLDLVDAGRVPGQLD